MKTRIILIIIVSIMMSGKLLPDERLAEIITQKQWTGLSSLCSDDSCKTLEKYFEHALAVRFVTYNNPKLTYKAKFQNYAEIGTIIYEKKEEKFCKLQIQNQITPLFFIERFKIYPIQDKIINVGEAVIHFQQGNLYQPASFDHVLFFNGSWKFTIKPSDEEERLTLTYQTKKNTFSTTNEWGIFILSDRDFVNKINPVRIVEADNNEIISLHEIFRGYFGIEVKQFDEYWYLPFKDNDNLVIFRKDKNNLLLYDFNSQLNPDTLLRSSPENKTILSYNAIKSTKLSFAETDKIEKLRLNLFLNPETNFISGTARLTFNNMSPFKVLRLAGGLMIKANLDLEAKGLSVVRKGNQYYFLGAETNQFSFFYSGNIESSIEYHDVFKRQIADVETSGMDNFFYLSRTQDFYPNSYIEFADVEVSVSVDQQYNCLATGGLLEARKADRNVYKFASKNAKGISLVIGDFESIKKIDSRLPIDIFCSDFSKKSKQFHIALRKEPEIQYGSKLDMLKKYFNFKSLKEAMDFFLEKFGDLDVPGINFLFKRGLQESGLSDKGLILYSFNPDQSLGQKINRDNPILLSGDSTNYLIHELAHQWWGGLISWKSYRDVWITEGLAQLSVILFLENKLPGKEIDNIIKRMKRWIFKNNDVGPVIYGERIIGIENDYIAYQSIVYNKAALIFFMLKDILGEEEFLKRLKNTLEKLKYRSVPSATFIKAFSEGSDTAARFLTKWINVRKIPEIDLHAVLEGKKAHLVFEQSDGNFIFPIKIEIKTEAGSTTKKLIIYEKRTVLDIAEDSEIKWIDVDDSRTLVRIKLQK